MSTTLDNGSRINLKGSIGVGIILPFDPFLGSWNQFERWTSYWLRAAHHRRTGHSDPSVHLITSCSMVRALKNFYATKSKELWNKGLPSC
ncbi:hypothetical protein F2Q70_00023042 [Brassica cretica]|uniref:Uncharacterized protein n=1 Tax=Brassica cretica TaxID=69181 RepID=A0A8S9GNY8_BRACR|nr:hypothetical protein F2Q70_00023042 [Brassica cretica]KAF3604923.1 hypothetical protein DY000_02050036 [Brassica cretica]